MSNQNNEKSTSTFSIFKTVGYLAGAAALAGAGYYVYKKFFDNEEETFVESDG